MALPFVARRMVSLAGIEPATFRTATGRSNPLSYKDKTQWDGRPGLNRRQLGPQPRALPLSYVRHIKQNLQGKR